MVGANPEANIGVDLLVISPMLAVLAGWAFWIGPSANSGAPLADWEPQTRRLASPISSIGVIFEYRRKESFMIIANRLIGGAACFTAACCLWAQEPVRTIQDLVGRNQRNGDNEMSQRGFRFVRVENSGQNSYQYFREDRSNRCVSVYMSGIQYRSLLYAPESDCVGGGNGGNGGGRGAAALQDLVGARGRDGDVQLQQRGYIMDRSEGRGNARVLYYQKRNECIEIELSNGRYTYVNDVPRSNCRGGNNASGVNGSGRPAAGLQDLVGADDRDGEFQLQQRGYIMDRSEDRGNARIVYYQRANECVETELSNGRYRYLNNVPRRNCRAGNAGPGGGWGTGGSNGSAPQVNTNVNAPQVNVDTSGRGDFTSDRSSGRVTRGFVNTTGEPSLGFRVDGRIVTFYGRIEREISNREFEMRINRSSESNANGNATFRLNEDRNEVELISVSGTMNGRPFNGNFRR